MISFREFLLELKEKLKRLLFYNLPITYSEDIDEKKEIFVPFQLKKEKKSYRAVWRPLIAENLERFYADSARTLTEDHSNSHFFIFS